MRLPVLGIALFIAVFYHGAVFPQAAGAPVCADPSRSLLWKIEGSNSRVYLFGSIHVGSADFYPLHPVIESAYLSADHVVFEVDPLAAISPENIAGMLMRGTLQDGKTLRDVISEPVLNDLVMVLSELGLPAHNFMSFQPWFLTMVLSSMQMTALGYLPDHGIEMYLIGKKPQQAQVLELESFQEQLNFLEQLNGETFLAYTLLEFENGKEKINQMIDAWRCADYEDLETILFSEIETEAANDPEMQRLLELLFYERNVKMSEGIQDYLENGKGDYFVVVGAGHLIGDRSVVDLLDDKYEVRGVRLQ